MVRALLFDWGNTIMVDDGRTAGPMCDWPSVEACPFAREALSALHPKYRIALATNADDSFEAEILRALERVGLDPFIDRVYCSNRIGARKPSARFFEYVVDDLKLPPGEIVMVGDSLERDVCGAQAAGIRALWYLPCAKDADIPPHVQHYGDHRDLPRLLEAMA